MSTTGWSQTRDTNLDEKFVVSQNGIPISHRSPECSTRICMENTASFAALSRFFQLTRLQWSTLKTRSGSSTTSWREPLRAVFLLSQRTAHTILLLELVGAATLTRSPRWKRSSRKSTQPIKVGSQMPTEL